MGCVLGGTRHRTRRDARGPQMLPNRAPQPPTHSWVPYHHPTSGGPARPAQPRPTLPRPVLCAATPGRPARSAPDLQEPPPREGARPLGAASPRGPHRPPCRTRPVPNRPTRPGPVPGLQLLQLTVPPKLRAPARGLWQFQEVERAGRVAVGEDLGGLGRVSRCRFQKLGRTLGKPGGWSGDRMRRLLWGPQSRPPS